MKTETNREPIVSNNSTWRAMNIFTWFLALLATVVSLVAITLSARSKQPLVSQASVTSSHMETRDPLRNENALLAKKVLEISTEVDMLEGQLTASAEMQNRLHSRIDALELKANEFSALQAKLNSTTAPAVVGNSEAIEKWDLHNATLEVKVLKVYQSAPTFAALSLEITNRSNAFISYWQVDGAVFDAKNSLLANEFTNGENLRPGESVVQDVTFAGIKHTSIETWKLRLGVTVLADEHGEELSGAERFIRLKELEGPQSRKLDDATEIDERDEDVRTPSQSIRGKSVRPARQ